MSASYDQSINMKKISLLCLCTVALVAAVPAQSQAPSPMASSPAATATPAASASSSPPDLADWIQRKVEEKLRGQHGITIDTGSIQDEEADLRKLKEFVAIPIVAIVFLSIFGAPVLIVIVIGLFALLISRMRQRTIRMMVEKGQPIPAELLAPATRSVRQRTDVRRGVVWAMIGLGLMIFFGAVTGWQDGVWSLGLIPLLVGLGYLIIWNLETKKDNPPPPS
jgi:hypothetical protein